MQDELTVREDKKGFGDFGSYFFCLLDFGRRSAEKAERARSGRGVEGARRGFISLVKLRAWQLRPL